jgi:hypothetical protein
LLLVTEIHGGVGRHEGPLGKNIPILDKGSASGNRLFIARLKTGCGRSG